MERAEGVETRKILVIDDDKMILTTIKCVLQANNYEIATTDRWVEALEYLEHERPDLVLMDLNMPHIDGTALVKFIRERGYDLPVVIVSGFVDEETEKELQYYNVAGVIRKPFEVRELQNQVKSILGPCVEDSDAADGPVQPAEEVHTGSSERAENNGPVDGPVQPAKKVHTRSSEQKEGHRRRRRRRRSKPDPFGWTVSARREQKREWTFFLTMVLVFFVLAGSLGLYYAFQPDKHQLEPPDKTTILKETRQRDGKIR